jgi:hypothetical protein
MTDRQEQLDEETRTVCWLKFITVLTDLSHVPVFASRDKLPEEAVNALDALMEDYRCNGPTLASQQVLYLSPTVTSVMGSEQTRYEKLFQRPYAKDWYCSYPR